MPNLFGTEHKHSTIKFPPNGVQHTFHLLNGVVFSAIQSDASHGNQNGEGKWEVCTWREHTSDPVTLAGADPEGLIGHLSVEQVGAKLREAAALLRAGA